VIRCPAAHQVPLVVLLGRQGSGKGEQSARLAAARGLDHVSTGALLRAAARDGSALGRTSETYLVRGTAVPDHLVIGVVAERIALAGAEGRGLVLDGYPRTVAQAERLAELVAPGTVDVAVHLDVPRHVAVERIQNRRVCPECQESTVATTSAPTMRCARCGATTTRRADDWPEAIGRRMSEYARDMDPLLRYYDELGVLVRVDGLGTPDEVAARVAAVVDDRLEASVS
jgi:adenylate kinase